MDSLEMIEGICGAMVREHGPINRLQRVNGYNVLITFQDGYAEELGSPFRCGYSGTGTNFTRTFLACNNFHAKIEELEKIEEQGIIEREAGQDLCQRLEFDRA